MDRPSLGDSPCVRLGSSLRIRKSGRTLATATGLMQALGISRVSEITRMDRLGLPVFAGIRPRGRALCVHAGKGMSAVDARVGALMEAIEYAVAEPLATSWTPVPMAVGRFLAQFAGQLDLVDFAPLFGRRITLDDVLTTVSCEELGRADAARLPAELVFAPLEPAGEAPFFGWTTNGLASGNSLHEATLHALLEIVERDALAMSRARDVSQWIAPADLPHPFGSMVADWREMGVETAVRHVPNAFGIACFEACVHEKGADHVNLASGSGAHLDRDIALSRAICEAAQSRLTHIHGGRDDIDLFYSRFDGVDATTRAANDEVVLQRFFDRERSIGLQEVPHHDGAREEGGIEALLSGLLARFAQAGFARVFRHRFDRDLAGLQVVKVIVPGCECVDGTPSRMGRRLFEQVTGATCA